MFGLGKQFIPYYADDDSIVDFVKYTQSRRSYQQGYSITDTRQERCRSKKKQMQISSIHIMELCSQFWIQLLRGKHWRERRRVQSIDNTKRKENPIDPG